MGLAFRTLVGKCVLACALFSAAATCGADTTQVLDTVVAFGRFATSFPTQDYPNNTTAAVRMQFPPNSPSYSPLYVNPLPTSVAGFVACQLTAESALVCIDDKMVRRWDAPSSPGNLYSNLFSCTNPAFGFDKKNDTCTGVTVELSGAIWLSGKKSNTYSLQKVVLTSDGTPAGTCPDTSWTQLASQSGTLSNEFCTKEFASGRPYFNDISDDEGDSYKAFPLGAGLSGVQTRNSIVYFSQGASSVTTYVIASGKTDLALSGNESVQSTALLRTDDTTNGTRFFFVYTTSTGKVRVVNWNPADVKVSDLVADATAGRGPAPPSNCTPAVSGDQFGVRVSPTTGNVYVSDRAYCRMLVLRPGSPTATYGTKYGFSLTQAFTPLSTGTLYPESPTVAEGIPVDLSRFTSNCTQNCTNTLVPGSNGTTAVKLSGVGLQQTGQSNMTLYLIKNIPDCRYITDTTTCPDRSPNVVTICPPGQPTASCPPASTSTYPDPSTAQEIDQARSYLNVTALLPSEIRQAYPNLPPMWIAPQYRAQARFYKKFDAILGIPQSDVQFKDTFKLEFYIENLVTGTDPTTGLPYQTKCPHWPTQTTQESTDYASNPLQYLLGWDVSTTVSERFLTWTNGTASNVNTLVSDGCGSGTASGGRYSIYTYNLEITPNTVSTVNSTQYYTPNDDAVFGKLLFGLYYDLYSTLDKYVCNVPPEASQDPSTSLAPLSGSVCDSLRASWANGLDKLTKCYSASTAPKQSSGAQNCTAFGSQLSNFIATLGAVPPAPVNQDKANRIGELKVRANIVNYVFNNKYTPSIPPNGFCEDPTVPSCNMYPVYP